MVYSNKRIQKENSVFFEFEILAEKSFISIFSAISPRDLGKMKTSVLLIESWVIAEAETVCKYRLSLEGGSNYLVVHRQVSYPW